MSTSTLDIDDDHRKKIESTQFLFMAAKSGVGKFINYSDQSIDLSFDSYCMVTVVLYRIQY